MCNYLIIYNHLIEYLDLCNILKIRNICNEFYHIFKLLKFNELVSKFHTDDKIGKFNFLIYNYSYLPKQGSIDWLNQRKGLYNDNLDKYVKIPKQYTVGGSEISTLLRLNPYSSIRTMAERKLNIGSKFNGNINTRWGNMFEPIITEYTEKYFKTSIKEFGSIPLLYDSMKSPIARYSPDGICIIKGENLRDINCIKINNNNIVLFEFKCPIRRMIKNEVPAHYINQPLMGMAGIDIIDFSIFGDGIFRKCNIKDFGFNEKYDRVFHTFDRTKFINPLLCGLIFIYDKKDIVNSKYENINNEYRNIKDMNISNELKLSYLFDICKKNNIYNIDFIKKIVDDVTLDPLIKLIHKYYTQEYNIDLLDRWNDLGNSNKFCEDTFANILADVECGKLCMEYSSDWLMCPDQQNEYLFNNISNIITKTNNNFYILPYKLFDIKYIPIKKDEEYFNKYEHIIHNFVDKVKKIRNKESNTDKEFPISDIDHVKYLKTQKRYKKVETPNIYTYTEGNTTYTEIEDADILANIL